jgi:hypothetical protein
MLERMTGVDIVFFTLSLSDSFYLVRSQKNRFFSRTHMYGCEFTTVTQKFEYVKFREVGGRRGGQRLQPFLGVYHYSS